MNPKTLYEKLWESHIVTESDNAPSILYIDLHLVHEVTSPQAFSGLREKGLKVRRPERTIATMDHSTPTISLSLDSADDMAIAQLEQITKNCANFGITLYDAESDGRGIVHVIGPEQGFTQPGKTIVCGDSHTSTHGAFGALAFGIGTSEVEHVLASQSLLQSKSKTYEVKFEGELPFGVTAKDMVLALITKIGIGGGTGHVFEFTGDAVKALDMDGRMTICNMAIEAGARAGMIAPDEVTFEYLKGRFHAPKGDAWDTAVAEWRKLPSDEGAVYDKTVTIDVSTLTPMVTYGTNPEMGIQIGKRIPSLNKGDAAEQSALSKALKYMDLSADAPLKGHPVDVVFIGSCTNSRMSDLRAAASILEGRKVADGMRLLVVPGSESIRKRAEAEGIDKIVRDAGGEWRFAGCSMCLAMNGDELEPGQYAVSTSNRNFEGRQGKGGRTILASPLTAAASAITGKVTDPRKLM
ncbi:MAG: 3-isopropylmalate dehydratase large subunit [Anaerolineae bacterium]|jgi:3-isopropylmalate/(R)-2-methylmalate dehydratase large subunit|nr:3-isopropylmalate dehydratase large subunit [Anaerolineae bacterium]MBT4312395.1 3-isopropylmalate dehydratase large subunit [Anaerolineae bacterium]MBT4459353.1 3-isopropylmalate dehydratase large subunit [Anaerolineae bacterium]MBT6320916.1 3-isopropylmalate dehydratase large subunit [Anaerolineae bacterium]MBT6812791.1 3-isopropylmalate dehydratase large subunit [Anaerolineae bacterium]